MGLNRDAHWTTFRQTIDTHITPLLVRAAYSLDSAGVVLQDDPDDVKDGYVMCFTAEHRPPIIIDSLPWVEVEPEGRRAFLWMRVYVGEYPLRLLTESEVANDLFMRVGWSYHDETEFAGAVAAAKRGLMRYFGF